MKKIDFGQIISILANLGVIAGIFFLAVEIRESKEQAIIANTLQGSGDLSQWMQFVASDTERSEFFYDGANDFRDLSDAEKSRFDGLMRSGLMQFMLIQLARDEGLAAAVPGDPEGRVIEGNLLRLWDMPGIRQWWKQADKRGIPPVTVQLIDELSEAN